MMNFIRALEYLNSAYILVCNSADEEYKKSLLACMKQTCNDLKKMIEHLMGSN